VDRERALGNRGPVADTIRQRIRAVKQIIHRRGRKERREEIPISQPVRLRAKLRNSEWKNWIPRR
jgi:hypothetical protein